MLVYLGIVLYLKVFASIQCQLYWNFGCFSRFIPSTNYMLLMNFVTELPYWGDIATQLNHFLCNFYVPRKCETKTIATKNRITSSLLFFPFFHFHVDFIALFFYDLANRYRSHWIDLWWLLLWEKKCLCGSDMLFLCAYWVEQQKLCDSNRNWLYSLTAPQTTIPTMGVVLIYVSYDKAK